jgi:hypothetical protein
MCRTTIGLKKNGMLEREFDFMCYSVHVARFGRVSLIWYLFCSSTPPTPAPPARARLFPWSQAILSRQRPAGPRFLPRIRRLPC